MDTPRTITEDTQPSRKTIWQSKARSFLIVYSSFMHNALVDGIAFTFGVFVEDLLTYFGESKGKTQLLGSVINGTYMMTGLFSGFLVNKFGCRSIAICGAILSSFGIFASTFSPNIDVMILLYGVVAGIGFGLIYLPAIIYVGLHFDKRRALATGIAVCGSGVGGFVFAPLSSYLIQGYGWKGAMWILSGIVLNSVVFAASYRPIRSAATSSSNDTKDAENPRCIDPYTDKRNAESLNSKRFYHWFRHSAYTHLSYVLYTFSASLFAIGIYIPFNFLPAYASTLNLSINQGALLISFVSITNTASRILTGLVSDHTWADPILINNVAVVVGGVMTCFVPFYKTFSVLALYSCVIGLALGTFVSLKSIITIELLGLEKLSTGMGIVNFFQGVSAIIGSPVAGALSDVTGNYNIAFYFSGIAIGLCGILRAPLRKVLSWEKNKNGGSYNLNES